MSLSKLLSQWLDRASIKVVKLIESTRERENPTLYLQKSLAALDSWDLKGKKTQITASLPNILTLMLVLRPPQTPTQPFPPFYFHCRPLPARRTGRELAVLKVTLGAEQVRFYSKASTKRIWKTCIHNLLTVVCLCVGKFHLWYCPMTSFN